jgi:hypothetical protein
MEKNSKTGHDKKAPGSEDTPIFSETRMHLVF